MMDLDHIQLGEIDQSDDLGAGLHDAARTGNRRSLKKILQRGIHVDYPNDRGQTPLFCACYFNHESAAELLLSHNGNPNERCNDGITPVHAACYNGNIRLLRKLLSYGGDLRLHDSSGRTVKDWTMLQPDPKKRLRMIEFIEKTKLFAMTNSGKDIFERDIASKQNRSFTGNTSIIDILKHRLGNAMEVKANTTKDVLKSVHSIGYGKVYLSNTQTGLISTVPLVTETMLKHDSFGLTFESGIGMVFESMMWNNTPVTVKRPHREAYISQVVDLLIHESDCLGKLHHPNILLMMGICQTNNLEGMVLIFERIQIGSLFYYLHQRYERLPTRDIQEILLQIAEALVYIHDQNLIHANVSSHAINLVTPHVAKLGNFDCMMKWRDPVSKTSSHLKSYMNKEAWNWMGPEIWDGSQPVLESDVYSFCAVIWEMYTNIIPWETVDFEDARERVSSEKEGLPVNAGKLPKLFKDILEYGLRIETVDRSLSMAQIRDIFLACPKDLKEYLKIGEQRSHQPQSKNDKSKHKKSSDRSWKDSATDKYYPKDQIIYSEEYSDGISNTLSVRSEAENKAPRNKSVKKPDQIRRNSRLDDNNSSNYGENDNIISSRRNSKSPMYQGKCVIDPNSGFERFSPDRASYNNYTATDEMRRSSNRYSNVPSPTTYSSENRRLYGHRSSVSPYNMENIRHSYSPRMYTDHHSPLYYQDVQDGQNLRESNVQPEMKDKAESPMSLHDYITSNSPTRSPEVAKSPTSADSRRSGNKWGDLKRQASAVIKKKKNLFRRKSFLATTKTQQTSPVFTDIANDSEKYLRQYDETAKYFPVNHEKFSPQQTHSLRAKYSPQNDFRIQNQASFKTELDDGQRTESEENSVEAYKELPLMNKRNSFSPPKLSYIDLAQMQHNFQPQQMACKPASHVVVPPSEKVGQLTTSGSIYALYNHWSPEEKENYREVHHQKSSSLNYRTYPPHRQLQYVDSKSSNLDSPDKEWFGGKGSVRNLVHLYQGQENEHKFQQDVLSRDLTSSTKLNELHRKDVNTFRKQIFFPNQPCAETRIGGEQVNFPTVHGSQNREAYQKGQYNHRYPKNNFHVHKEVSNYNKDQPYQATFNQHQTDKNGHMFSGLPQPPLKLPPYQEHTQPVQQLRQNFEHKMTHVYREEKSYPEPSAPVLSHTTFDRIFGNQNKVIPSADENFKLGRPEIPPLDLCSEASDVKKSDSKGSLTSVSVEDSVSNPDIKGDSLESQLVNRWVSKELRKVSKEILTDPSDAAASPDLFDSYGENDTTIKANGDVGKNYPNRSIKEHSEVSRENNSMPHFTNDQTYMDHTQGGEYYFDDELHSRIDEVDHFQLYSDRRNRELNRNEENSLETPGDLPMKWRRERSKSTEVTEKREKLKKSQEKKSMERRKCYERKVVICSSVDQPGKHVVKQLEENFKTGGKRLIDERIVEGNTVTSTFTFP